MSVLRWVSYLLPLAQLLNNSETGAAMGHTPGRGHRMKSDPPKKRRFKRKAAKRRAEAEKRYEEAKKEWEAMPEEARRLCPELNPELSRPA